MWTYYRKIHHHCRNTKQFVWNMLSRQFGWESRVGIAVVLAQHNTRGGAEKSRTYAGPFCISFVKLHAFGESRVSHQDGSNNYSAC